MKHLIATLILLLASSLFAENIAFWKIQKVKSNDSLNMRSKADHKSKKVSSIPYNAQCLKNHGCGKNISFEAMMNMEEEEVKAFLEQAQDEWCYVEYKGISGWVNQYYLSPSKSACK